MLKQKYVICPDASDGNPGFLPGEFEACSLSASVGPGTAESHQLMVMVEALLPNQVMKKRYLYGE